MPAGGAGSAARAAALSTAVSADAGAPVASAGVAGWPAEPAGGGGVAAAAAATATIVVDSVPSAAAVAAGAKSPASAGAKAPAAVSHLATHNEAAVSPLVDSWWELASAVSELLGFPRCQPPARPSPWSPGRRWRAAAAAAAAALRGRWRAETHVAQQST